MATTIIGHPAVPITQPQPEVEKKSAPEYWQQYMLGGMAPLFEASGTYTPEEQASHLKFLNDHLPTVLGPLPTDPHPQYAMPYVGSPFEPSLNLTSNGKAKVRVGIEVVGPADRTTGDDPFGEDLSRKTLARIAKEVAADMRWSECLMRSLFLTSQETEAVRNIVPPSVPASMLAFDFDGSNRSMKTYFPSHRKAMATGRTSTELILEALRSLNPLADQLAPSLDLLESYLKTCKNDCTLMLVGMDCVDPKDSRIKCYMHVSDNSWNNVKDVMTFGGLLTDEHTLKGLEILKRIYHLLRNEPEGRDDAWHKPDQIDGIPFSGIQFSVELMAGRAIPEIKLYVPMYQYAKREEALANFEAMLRKLNHEWGYTGKYRETMKYIFGEKPVCGMGFASFSYSKKKGAYMTSYFAPPTDYELPTFNSSDFLYI